MLGLSTIGYGIDRLIRLANFLSPFISVLVRVWIALIFWKSGLTKIASWDATMFLFEYEYQVPFLTPKMAAILATATELTAPIMLVAGFGARIAAVALLVMIAVIELTYQTDPHHTVWALFLGIIATQGPGRFSWDFFISQRFAPDEPEEVSGFTNFLATAMITVLTILVVHEGIAAAGKTNAWLEAWERQQQESAATSKE